MLQIYAGANALKTIQEHGFKQELFTNFLGASGGPKWFTLFGLDKYLFGEFFKNRVNELNLIGSSAGAFRAACFAQKSPVEAIERLAYKYARVVYSEKPTPQEISDNATEIISHVFGESGEQEILDNDIFKAHFIVAKCIGFTASESKYKQGAGLLSSMLLNKINRQYLSLQYQRFIFKHPSSQLTISDPYKIPSYYINLQKQNIGESLMASGSIPMVMAGVKNIQGAPSGMYRDGGIIDYHFDFTLEQKSKGLTLYPHFNSTPKAGWFDKNSNRAVLNSSYDDVVMLAPSDEFINSLPYKKIPDRTDFNNLDANTRLNYWLTVLKETERLADAFNEFIVKQKIESILPFQR